MRKVVWSGKQEQEIISREILWSFPGSDKANMASAAENDEMCEEDEESTVNNGERTLKEGSFL